MEKRSAVLIIVLAVLLATILPTLSLADADGTVQLVFGEEEDAHVERLTRFARHVRCHHLLEPLLRFGGFRQQVRTRKTCV